MSLVSSFIWQVALLITQISWLLGSSGLRHQRGMVVWPRVTLFGQVTIRWAGDFLGSRQDGWAWGGLVAPPTPPAPASPPPSGSSAAFGRESSGLQATWEAAAFEGGTPTLLGAAQNPRTLPLRCRLLWRQERLLRLRHDRRLLWIRYSLLREQRRCLWWW